ncbi:MAG: hypothetical protein ACRD5M_02945 [Candidatus Acidiferrales bacterium]
MRKHSEDQVTKRFTRLDFHDDNLRLVTIHPPKTRHDTTTMEFEFEDDETGAKKLLSFHSCGNVRFLMDFDVLADNWFAQTKGLHASANAQEMRKIISSQLAHWRTSYMPPLPPDKPVRKKLNSIRKSRKFKIKFFGGTVEILAKSFKLK